MTQFFYEKKFFEQLRIVTKVMTLVEILPEGHLYYYDSPYNVSAWVVVGKREVIVAYPWLDSPTGIRERVKVWHEAILNRVTLEPHDFMSCGCPVYGAQEDPDGGQPIVVWLYPGDWCGLSADDPYRPEPVKWDLLPPHWPESYRDRIRELAQTRVGRAPERNP
jgi:hypothetical protein